MSNTDQFNMARIPIRLLSYKDKELAETKELLIDNIADGDNEPTYHMYIVDDKDRTILIDLTEMIIKEAFPTLNADNFNISIEGLLDPQKLTDIIKFNNITETPLIKELDSIKEQSAYISKLGELFESNDKNDINYVIFTLSSIISNEECVDFKNETIEMIVNKNIFKELFEIIENSDEIAVVSYIALIMYNISYSFNSLNEQITNTIMNLFQDKIPLSIFTKEHLRNNKNLFEILICLLQSL